MALCHTAIVSKHKIGMSSKFISESEDEIALLTFAKSIGFRFSKNENDTIELKVYGETHIFKVLGILPFDPVRKMMSVIVQGQDGATLVFTKGADSSVLNCCNLTAQKKEKI